MKNWVSRRTLAFAVAVIAAAIPALGQEGPESLLPPGFGPPAPSRPVAPAVPSAPAPATEGQAEAAPAAELPDEATASEEPESYRLPPPVSRPIDQVGAIGPGTTGFPQDAFGSVSGPYLTTLMQRLATPIASRWVAIVLRRALLSSVPTAPGSRPADWVAEQSRSEEHTSELQSLMRTSSSDFCW